MSPPRWGPRPGRGRTYNVRRHAEVTPPTSHVRPSSVLASAAALAALLVAVPAGAQWRNLPNPVPNGPDGKPNLSAPAPRTASGKPDLNGIYTPTTATSRTSRPTSGWRTCR